MAHDHPARDAVVREASEADVDALAAFFRAAWAEAGPDAPGFAGATDEIMDELTSRQVLRGRIVGEGRGMWIAVADASTAPQIVGFAATRAIDESVVELAGIVVRRAHAGTGLGAALVDMAMERSASSHRSMIVRTETTNTGARAFYERCGFRVTGTIVEDVDGTPVEVWELERSLQP